MRDLKYLNSDKNIFLNNGKFSGVCSGMALRFKLSQNILIICYCQRKLTYFQSR